MVVERSDAVFQQQALPARVIIATLRAGEPAEFVVRGASMWPAIRAGALVRATPCDPNSLRPGDLAAFERRGQVVVHRVASVRRDGFEFRGDALDGADGRVAAGDVLGRVVVVRQPELRLRIPRAVHVIAVARSLRSWLGASARRWVPR